MGDLGRLKYRFYNILNLRYIDQRTIDKGGKEEQLCLKTAMHLALIKRQSTHIIKRRDQ